MGWPKKNEGFRLYFERKAKTYLLVDVESIQDRRGQLLGNSYDGVGEVLTNNNPENPCLASCNPDPAYLYRKCRRASWDEMPEVWQNALAEWINGDPKNFRGLWRIEKS